MKLSKSILRSLVYEVTGAAIEVHRAIGPGLLEQVYQRCMAEELAERGLQYQSELLVPVVYKEITLDAALRVDFFVEETLIVELKAAEKILPIHEAQILTYMKLLEVPQGIILNFNVSNIYREGQRSFVNEWYRDLPE